MKCGLFVTGGQKKGICADLGSLRMVAVPRRRCLEVYAFAWLWLKFAWLSILVELLQKARSRQQFSRDEDTTLIEGENENRDRESTDRARHVMGTLPRIPCAGERGPFRKRQTWPATARPTTPDGPRRY